MFKNGKVRSPRPLLAVLELTSKCNLSCRHCSFFGLPRLQSRDMSFRQWKRIIDILVDNGCERVTLSGGEPTLYRRLPDIIAYCSRKGLYTAMTTNGIAMTRSLAAKLVEAGVDYVQVSLDGLMKQHETLRGSGTYEPALRALKFLSDAGARVCILCVISTLNDRSIPEFVAMLQSLNIRNIGFERLTPPVGSDRMMQIALRPARLKRALQTIYSLKKEYPEARISLNEPLKVHMDARIRQAIRGKRTPSGGCFAGGFACVISPNGDLRPCTRLPFNAGNLLKMNFNTIWNENDLLNALRNRRMWGPCGACRHRDICGGCRAEALSSYGDLFACDPGCWLQPKRRSNAKFKSAQIG